MIRDSLIVTPLKSEFSLLTDALVSHGLKASDEVIGSVPIKVFPELNLICAIGGHGKVQFGIQTQFLVNHFSNACRVFCVGAAGGLAKVKTFDVVVAEKTIEHDYTERFDPGPVPVFGGCQLTIAKIKTKIASLKIPFGVHYGFIASGDEDIVSLERAAELHHKTKAIAVAWEGAGGARASAFNRKPFIEVRGITDVADNQAPIDFRSNLKRSLENVSVVLINMIEGNLKYSCSFNVTHLAKLRFLHLAKMIRKFG